MTEIQFQIEPLDKRRHNRSEFSCGVEALDLYLHRQASQDIEKHVAVVYVATSDGSTVAGYYTLSQFSVNFVQLPEQLAKRLPRYPVIPATLLGRLAVALPFRGQSLGKLLLFDALKRSFNQSRHLASAGVIVDAKDERARSFYLQYGFVPIIDAGNRLFLPMKTIERLANFL